jgi:hypothetical protein
MRPKTIATAFLVLAVAAFVAGCSSKCPVPVAYSEAQLKEIQKARQDLPKDSILHQVLEDYETERDDLRFCR